MDQALRGETAVDLHHRVQLGLVKALEAQLGPGGDRAESARTLSRLLEFTRIHFEAEELVMGLHAYPQAEAHAEAHRRLLAQAEDLRRAHGQGDGPEARRTAERLRSWLLDHVRGADQAFSAWCEQNGIRPD
jgi:hemerythrin